MKKNYSIMIEQFKKKRTVSIFALAFMASINLNAQNLWTGATDNLFMTPTNWTTTPLFDGTDNFRIVATTNNPITLNNSAATTPAINVVQLQTSAGTELTTASDITSTSTSLSVYIGNKLHITGGTFWGKGNIYFGNNAGETPYCNVETSATLKVKAAILVGRNSPAIIDVNGGTITGESGGGLSLGNYGAAGTGVINLNSGLIKILKVSGLAVSTYGTLNVFGGKVEEPAGDLIVKGTLNVNGGLVNLLAGVSTINNTAAGAGTINLNSGSITIGGVLNAINGTINVDAGTLVLTGDQTTAMAAYITAGNIKLSAGAVTAGKTLSNTFDSVTGLTTIAASAPLGVNGIAETNSFSVYPNPSKGVINIDTKNAGLGNLNVVVYNLLGQEVTSATLEGNNSGSYTLDASAKLTSGTYIVKIKSNSSNYSSKIVVK